MGIAQTGTGKTAAFSLPCSTALPPIFLRQPQRLVPNAGAEPHARAGGADRREHAAMPVRTSRCNACLRDSGGQAGPRAGSRLRRAGRHPWCLLDLIDQRAPTLRNVEISCSTRPTR
ncbi:MAG: hypothetical protein R3E03_00470 [Novosphingobium sp.]